MTANANARGEIRTRKDVTPADFESATAKATEPNALASDSAEQRQGARDGTPGSPAESPAALHCRPRSDIPITSGPVPLTDVVNLPGTASVSLPETPPPARIAATEHQSESETIADLVEECATNTATIRQLQSKLLRLEAFEAIALRARGGASNDARQWRPILRALADMADNAPAQYPTRACCLESLALARAEYPEVTTVAGATIRCRSCGRLCFASLTGAPDDA